MKCPVCEEELKGEIQTLVTSGNTRFACANCGTFETGVIAYQLITVLAQDERKRAILSHTLRKMQSKPRAGLIDDRLRVEIRNARFLIADLTDDNEGAYWEAGFAEGLSKPVIFICEKTKFKKKKTHFDTNHHLTVKWDKDSPQDAAEELKATIRATLPDEARMTDD
jgi:hypothetical protein